LPVIFVMFRASRGGHGRMHVVIRRGGIRAVFRAGANFCWRHNGFLYVYGSGHAGNRTLPDRDVRFCRALTQKVLFNIIEATNKQCDTAALKGPGANAPGALHNDFAIPQGVFTHDNNFSHFRNEQRRPDVWRRF
jgi:hypothetical protein